MSTSRDKRGVVLVYIVTPTGQLCTVCVKFVLFHCSSGLILFSKCFLRHSGRQILSRIQVYSCTTRSGSVWVCPYVLSSFYVGWQKGFSNIKGNLYLLKIANKEVYKNIGWKVFEVTIYFPQDTPKGSLMIIKYIKIKTNKETQNKTHPRNSSSSLKKN